LANNLHITGKLPESLSSLPLLLLVLSNNNITGTIPQGFGTMTALQFLYVSSLVAQLLHIGD
jgi:hypothetical protein